MYVLGDKRSLLKCDSTTVLLECIQRQKSTKDNSKPQGKTGLSKSEKQNSSTKPKVVIVKSQNSSEPGPSTEREKVSEKEKLPLKRKRPVIIDSDDSDLDFGEQSSESLVVKKRYIDHSPSSQENGENGVCSETNGVGNSVVDAIELDSDSND